MQKGNSKKGHSRNLTNELLDSILDCLVALGPRVDLVGAELELGEPHHEGRVVGVRGEL